MKCTSIRRVLVPGTAALVLGLTLSACSAANESGAATEDGTEGVSSGLSGTLNGGGASSQQAAHDAWSVGFQAANSDVTVNYDPVGSGGGREGFISGGFSFAGTDSYLADEELEPAAERCGGTDAIEIPNYVSPIAVIFNVEGVDELRLDPETLAGIFAGKVTTWDDPAIVATNDGVELPSAPINAVHRSDESGTTANFTSYLSNVAGDVWTDGSIETWPTAAGGEGAKGTSGVVSAVQNGENSIGYADASQAGELDVALIGVGEDWVEPSAEAAAKILEVSPRVEGRADTDLAFDLDHNTDAGGAYPIVLTSYLIACQSYDDPETADLVKGYLSYILSDEGQAQGAAEAGAAPLAPDLQQQAMSIVEGIQAG